MYYLVRWEDSYPDTWERIEDINNHEELLQKYHDALEVCGDASLSKKRCLFLPEAMNSNVNHGLTKGMLNNILSPSGSDGNTNNNALKSDTKTKIRTAAVKNKTVKKGNSIEKTNRNVKKDKSKVVSKPKGVKSSTAKVTAARTKAVKILTKSKSSPNKTNTKGGATKNTIKDIKRKFLSKSNKNATVKSNTNPKPTSREKANDNSNSQQAKERVSKSGSKENVKNSPARSTNSDKSQTIGNKNKITVAATKSGAKASPKNAQIKRSAAKKPKIESQNGSNTDAIKNAKESSQSKSASPKSAAVTNKKVTTTQIKNDTKFNVDKTGNIANKSRKRTAADAAASSSPGKASKSDTKPSPSSLEPKPKKPLLARQSSTSTLNSVRCQSDSDNEAFTAILQNHGATKKTLKLSIFDVRSAVAVSNSSTPNSDREVTFKQAIKGNSPPRATGNVGPCTVCGDKSAGYHYGAISCDACRSFFKRTMQPPPVVFRPCDKNCEMTVASRRDCQACRFQSCLQAGMSGPRYFVNYSPRKMTLLSAMPTSLINSPCKTPPRVTGLDSSTGSELVDSIPDIPVMPMLPNSPAASHRNLMKRMKHLEADRGVKRSENGEVERRTSVRQSESVFRYKDIVVKKCMGYTQILLSTTSTKMKNALSAEVLSEIRGALDNARKDDSRLVMLSGQGSIFCSGLDLAAVQTSQHAKLVSVVKDFVQMLISYPKPIVAVVNGPAVGFGAAFLPLCDIVYASDKASFYCPYSRLCQTPEACSSFTFPNVMGAAMANEMLLAGRKLTALEALQAGLVSHVFWPTSMMQEVIPRLTQMAQSSAKALEASKLLIRSHQRAKLDFTNETECQVLSERWQSQLTLKAIESFLEEEHEFLGV